MLQKNQKYIEWTWGIIIFTSGILPRVLFAYYFPAQPVSDFRMIVDFAIEFSQNVFSNFIAWRSISPGLPFILSLALKLLPALSPEDIGRWSTVLLTSLIALLPYLIWKDVFPLNVRRAAGLLLALWPAQILFSTVVAQDNWVMLPTVALGALALRTLKARENGKPVWGAILYALALFIRQEMLVVLLPAAFIVISGFNLQTRSKNLLRGGLIVMALLSLLIFHRGRSTGTYALSSAHIGRSMLGSYVPGAGLGWVDPSAYLAATKPELLYQLDEDFEAAQSAMVDLAVNEFIRRTQFHIARIAGASIYALFDGDSDNLFWSLSAPNVLADNQQNLAQMLVRNAAPYLKAYALAIHMAFVSALIFSGWNKKLSGLVLPIALVILLKLAVHAVIVITPRYFLVAIALELMLIAIMADEFLILPNRKFAVRSAMIGFLLVALVYFYPYQMLKKYVLSNAETNIQHSYKFPLQVAGAESITAMDCFMNKGWLGLNGSSEATINFIHYHPYRNETATVTCDITATSPTLIHISIFDPYQSGGIPDKIYQNVYINGSPVMQHDISAVEWSGWFDVPLQISTSTQVTIELLAKNPRSAWKWDRDMTPTKFMFWVKK